MYYFRNGMTEHEGISLVIHNKTSPPELDNKAINIRTNTRTDIGIGLRTVQRKKAPYTSKCIDSYPDAITTVEDEFSYSSTYCKADSKSFNINATCGCFHPYFMTAKVSLRTLIALSFQLHTTKLTSN